MSVPFLVSPFPRSPSGTAGRSKNEEDEPAIAAVLTAAGIGVSREYNIQLPRDSAGPLLVATDVESYGFWRGELPLLTSPSSA